jgi:hypothetical protein
MSTMEPDEGAKADDQPSDAPRWDKVEAANPPDDAEAEGRRWPEADTDAESSDTDGSDAFDVTSSDS